MSQIISMSLNKNILKQLDKVQDEMGFSGRSEAIRAGIRALIAERKENAKLKGEINAALIVVHDDKFSEEVSKTRHRFEDIIKTQLHNHAESHKCLEIFVLRGEAQEILKLSEAFQTNKKIEFAKLIPL